MDFIKKLISGIVGFLTGLLPGKKKKSNGYFLELDESKDAKPVAAVTEAAKEAAKEVADNAKKAAETVADNAKKVAETVTSPSKAESLNGTKTAASKSSKSKKKSTKEAKPADVQLVQTAQGLKVEPGKNDKAAAARCV